MNHRRELNVHDGAKNDFNAKAQELLELVAPEQGQGVGEQPSFRPDAHVAHNLTEKDIIAESIIKSQVDITGRKTGKFFHREGLGWVGLEGESYKKLVELADLMQRRNDLREFLSLEFIEGKTFEWLKASYSQEEASTAADYVLHKGNEALDLREVWLPIPTLSTKIVFPIGKVKFKPISKNMLDAWQEDKLRSVKTNEDAKKLESYMLELRTKFQSLAAATMEVFAEPIRAREIAFTESDKATSALRIFSPEILHPYGRSYWEPLSFLDPSAFDVFFAKGDRFVSRQSWMPPDRAGHPAFDQNMVVQIYEMGLAKVDSLLRNDNPTPFQRDCLNALLQYSKAALKRDPSEKLLYIISALESILLRETHEGGIGKNLEERLAVFIRSDLRERLALMEKIRAIYKLRSDFVHHSLPVKDLELVSSFMIDAMAAFRNLLLASGVYREKADFIRDLEFHRLAGPRYQPQQFATA